MDGLLATSSHDEVQSGSLALLQPLSVLMSVVPVTSRGPYLSIAKALRPADSVPHWLQSSGK